MKARNFNDDDYLKSYLQAFFYLKPKEFYACGIYDLPGRWREITLANGEYIGFLIKKFFWKNHKKYHYFLLNPILSELIFK